MNDVLGLSPTGSVDTSCKPSLVSGVVFSTVGYRNSSIHYVIEVP